MLSKQILLGVNRQIPKTATTELPLSKEEVKEVNIRIKSIMPMKENDKNEQAYETINFKTKH